MSWDKLSFREKAQAIRIGVKNGLTDIDSIKSAYNNYMGSSDASREVGQVNKYDGDTEDTQQMNNGRTPYAYGQNDKQPYYLNEEGQLVNDNGDAYVLQSSDMYINGKDYSKPYESAYNDDLKTLLLHGIPESASWLLGNTVGRVVDKVPLMQEGLSLITPSRWAGVVGGAINGDLVAPWSEDNQGWSSLLGDEYGEAADFYGDLFGAKLLTKGFGKVTGKSAGATEEASTFGKQVATKEKTLGQKINEAVDKKLDYVYSKLPLSAQHVYNIATDAANPYNWKAIYEARKNGEYPITSSEIKEYYRRALREAYKGLEWNRDVLRDAPAFADVNFFSPSFVNDAMSAIKPRLLRGSDYVHTHGKGSSGITMIYNLDRMGNRIEGEIPYDLMLTKERSNLPNIFLNGKGRDTIKGVSAHEANHAVQRFGKLLNSIGLSKDSPYIEDIYRYDRDYFGLDWSFLNTDLGVLDIPEVYDIAGNKIVRGNWEKSANEVWSEFSNYRATNDIPYNAAGYSSDIINDFVNQYGGEFLLDADRFKKVVNWGVANGRAYGGILKNNKK